MKLLLLLLALLQTAHGFTMGAVRTPTRATLSVRMEDLSLIHI